MRPGLRSQQHVVWNSDQTLTLQPHRKKNSFRSHVSNFSSDAISLSALSKLAILSFAAQQEIIYQSRNDGRQGRNGAIVIPKPPLSNNSAFVGFGLVHTESVFHTTRPWYLCSLVFVLSAPLRLVLYRGNCFDSPQ